MVEEKREVEGSKYNLETQESAVVCKSEQLRNGQLARKGKKMMAGLRIPQLAAPACKHFGGGVCGWWGGLGGLVFGVFHLCRLRAGRTKEQTRGGWVKKREKGGLEERGTASGISPAGGGLGLGLNWKGGLMGGTEL